jgi:hypothetical protein
MEIKITVHTASGDVTTSYTAAQIELALAEIKQRVEDKQMFTVKGL